MHRWEDRDVDWEAIDDAAEYIGTGLRKWGRISVQDYKEKFGTVRVYCNFGWYSLHSITHPGWSYIQYTRGSILWNLEYSPIVQRLVGLLGILVTPYQKWLYYRYYRAAIRQWPHTANEILVAADHPDLLQSLLLDRERME